MEGSEEATLADQAPYLQLAGYSPSSARKLPRQNHTGHHRGLPHQPCPQKLHSLLPTSSERMQQPSLLVAPKLPKHRKLSLHLREITGPELLLAMAQLSSNTHPIPKAAHTAPAKPKADT